MSENENTPAVTDTPAKKPRKVRTGPVLNKDGLLRKAAKAKTVDEFESEIARFKPSRKLLKQAKAIATAEGDDTAILDGYLARLGVSATGRGRTAPKENERRAYSVQVLHDKASDKDGGPFVRVPLDTLGVKKKDKVSITFRSDKIVIKVKGASAQTDANVPVEEIDASGAEAPADAPAAAA